MKISNRLIVGTAIGLAVIAVAIDHTKHRLPDAEAEEQMEIMDSDESPCSMSSMSSDIDEEDYIDSDSSPCGMGD